MTGKSVRAGHILSPSLRPAAVGRATELCPALSDFPVTPGDLTIPNGCLDAYEVKVNIDIFKYQEKVKLISQFQRFFHFSMAY